ncbi:hypothetical protein AVEN_191939-1 [Araneus ventricosus]|uniref:Uncharacterized protein n=1 Tax=Araneus ventricosus TaxID=182803 RepID=A0A4Y2S187_ARAVE|nr:hypothetical protein AVEN_191939-1 [Araneus ventricosus]
MIDNEGFDVDCIWFTYEAHFHLNGFVNKQNWRFWVSENPHLCEDKPLHSPEVTAWVAASFVWFFAVWFIPGPSYIPVMSSRDVHRAAESQAGLFYLEFLYGLKRGSKKDVIQLCMDMNMIAKEYVCPICGEKMALTQRDGSDGYSWFVESLVRMLIMLEGP